MKKDAAVKPADPELKVELDSWNEVGRKLIAMAEDFPEDKYDFKLTPALGRIRTLLHLANFFLGSLPNCASWRFCESLCREGLLESTWDNGSDAKIGRCDWSNRQCGERRQTDP